MSHLAVWDIARSRVLSDKRTERTVRRYRGRRQVSDHVYRIIQVAGSSENSIDDAIKNAIGRASRTVRQIGWFEVVETRGHVEGGTVAHYQVTLKVGFTLDDD